MKRQDDLSRTLLWCIVAICLMFFAFAAGVWYLEKEEQDAEVEIGEAQLAAVMPISATQEPQERQLGPCEDTYLRDDIPLSYELQAMLYGACIEFEIDYDLALAVVEQETDFRNIVGDDGASVGFMQIQDRWWGDLMEEIGARDLTDPEDNFRTGCAILRQLLDRYGNTEDALSAYNTGRPGETRYSREVMERMQKYGQ